MFRMLLYFAPNTRANCCYWTCQLKFGAWIWNTFAVVFQMGLLWVVVSTYEDPKRLLAGVSFSISHEWWICNLYIILIHISISNCMGPNVCCRSFVRPVLNHQLQLTLADLAVWVWCPLLWHHLGFPSMGVPQKKSNVFKVYKNRWSNMKYKKHCSFRNVAKWGLHLVIFSKKDGL